MGFLYLIAVLILLAPVFALISFFKARALGHELEKTRENLRDLSRQTAQLAEALRVLQGQAAPYAASPVSNADAPATEAKPGAQEDAPDIQSEPPPLSESVPPPAETIDERQTASDTAASAPAPEGKSLEEALTSRWLVWLGALAIGLAGTFLVKYAIDSGLLGPAMRVSLGLLLGLALIAGGEWLRQRPLQRAIAAVRNDHVPPSLTASGLFIAFASIYAAFALYNLLPPLIAFAGLALVALLGVGLSILQGRFVALAGLLGAFVAPALVPSPNPSAWALFLYLLVVEAACLGVARTMSWAWYALATAIGVVVWPLLWIAAVRAGDGDLIPLGVFLVASAAGFFAMLRGMPEAEPGENWLAQVQRARMPERVVWLTACVIAFVLFVVVGEFGYNTAGIVFVCLLSGLFIFVGRGNPVFDGLPVVAAALAVLVAASMPVPDMVTAPPSLPGAPWIPPELGFYAGVCTVFALLFGVTGFVVLWGAARPALWAAISAVVPFLLLVIAYYRIVDFGVDFGWAALSLALAAASLFAAERVERYRAARGLEATLGFYAAGVVACLSLAAAMCVREAWLSVALSAQLPALAWIDTKLRTRALQVIAAIIASAVLTRLIFNYNILDYALGGVPAFSWVLYGYGLPMLAFYAAARLYRGLSAHALVMLLEAGALAFFVLLVSMEIRLIVTGSLSAPRYGLLEQSLQAIAWLSTGTALALYHRRKSHKIASYGAMILLGVAAAQIVLFHLIAFNPFFTGEFIGNYPVVNVLLLAYAVPAAFAFYGASFLGKTDHARLGTALAIAGFVLVFAYLSLEVAHAYQGARLSLWYRNDAQNYTYSVVWIAYALGLLALGIRYGVSLLRYASLAIVLFTAFKVFLLDMSGLTGLYRVASFLGLGLSLVGVGFIYQRFVFRGPGAKPDTSAKG